MEALQKIANDCDKIATMFNHYAKVLRGEVVD